MSTPLERHLTRQNRATEFFWHRLRWELVKREIATGRPSVVLDVGAGTGVLGEFIQRTQRDVGYLFIEPISVLERSLEARFGNIANAAHRDTWEDVDLVALLDVLEHQADDRAFLNDLVQQMRVGAILVVTVPAIQFLWSRWDVALGHYRRYDRYALLSLASGLPLDIVRLEYAFPEMLPLALWRRLRSPASGNELDDPRVEFPELPRLLNGVLYRVGRGTRRFGRRAPIGTSLLLVARRSNAPHMRKQQSHAPR
jgi:SAM-dependent methyltransferase